VYTSKNLLFGAGTLMFPGPAPGMQSSVFQESLFDNRPPHADDDAYWRLLFLLICGPLFVLLFLLQPVTHHPIAINHIPPPETQPPYSPTCLPLPTQPGWSTTTSNNQQSVVPQLKSEQMAAAAEPNWLEWSKVTIGFKPYPQQRNCLTAVL